MWQLQMPSSRLYYPLHISTINYPLDSKSKSATVFELFQRQVERDPDKLALVLTDASGKLVQSLSYRELAEWSKQIATRLIASQVGPGDSVAIEARHSAATVAAMLAIARIGAVYVPLDFAYPQERLEFMISDTAARLLLCTSDLSASELTLPIKLESIGDIEEALPHDTAIPDATNDTLYIMYTSGSTGGSQAQRRYPPGRPGKYLYPFQ